MAGALWGANVMSAASADMEGTVAYSAGAQSSAVAVSTTTANFGTQSTRCTYNGTTSGALCVNNTTEIPVAANTTYYVSGWFFTNGTGLSVNINVEWYTSAQVFINSVVVATVAVAQNTWTQYPAVSFTTGASSAFLRLNPQRTAGLTSGDFVYLDTFRVSQLLSPAVSLPVDWNPCTRAAVW